MKISIAASILILLVAALFGVPSYQRLVDVRASHAKLVATAAQLGMAMDSSRPDSPIRNTKRQRENRMADAKCFATELIAYAKELEAMGKNQDRSDEIQQKRS